MEALAVLVVVVAVALISEAAQSQWFSATRDSITCKRVGWCLFRDRCRSGRAAKARGACMQPDLDLDRSIPYHARAPTDCANRTVLYWGGLSCWTFVETMEYDCLIQLSRRIVQNAFILPLLIFLVPVHRTNNLLYI